MVVYNFLFWNITIPVRVAANWSAKTSLSGIFFSTGYLAVNLKGLVESQKNMIWLENQVWEEKIILKIDNSVAGVSLFAETGVRFPTKMF